MLLIYCIAWLLPEIFYSGLPADSCYEKGEFDNLTNYVQMLAWSSLILIDICILACVAGAKRGGRGGGRKAPPSLFPYPLPLSTPATQAICIWTLHAEKARGTTLKRLLFNKTIVDLSYKKWSIESRYLSNKCSQQYQTGDTVLKTLLKNIKLQK